jgi:RimJ/RimL family protein N-acetyltransferase
MCWTVHHDVDETRGVIRSFLEGWERGEHFNFMLELKDGGKLIGCVSIAPTAHSHEMLMGWLVAREYWGVGYAAEAIRPLVTWGLSLPEVYRVSAICDVDNPASARAAEKAGMQREAILRRFAIHPNVSLAPRDVIVMAAVK